MFADNPAGRLIAQPLPWSLSRKRGDQPGHSLNPVFCYCHLESPVYVGLKCAKKGAETLLPEGYDATAELVIGAVIANA